MNAELTSSSDVSEGTQARLDAARIITTWLEERHYPEDDLDQIKTQRGFVMDVVYGVLRHYRALEWVMERLMDREPPPSMQGYLLVGIYQLLFMPDVEDYAAVHETVEALRPGGRSRQMGFVNAVLRRLQRERDEHASALQSTPMGIHLSHPDILIERWTASYGEKATKALCEWNNRPADVLMRIRGEGQARYEETLAEAGIEAARSAVAGYLICPRGLSVTRLPGFDAGALVVQDPATRLAVELADLSAGMTVLDPCAAPGGKAVHLADCVGETGCVIALDGQEDRLDRLRENVARCGVSWVTVGCADARDPKSLLPFLPSEGVDCVVLDVPCTNTGVFRRRPDARWRFSARRLQKIRKQQRAILDGSSQVVKPGGTLIYSTCSLEPEENQDFLGHWLAGNTSFSLEKEVRSLPWVDGVDGAYAARLRRA